MDNSNSNEHLTPQQRHALDLLVAGKTVTEAAREAGVARETVSRWRHQDPEFKAEFFIAMRSISEANQKKRLDAQTKAIDRLLEIADSDDDMVALKACSVLLKLGAHLPDGSVDPHDHRFEQQMKDEAARVTQYPVASRN